MTDDMSFFDNSQDKPKSQ